MKYSYFICFLNGILLSLMVEQSKHQTDLLFIKSVSRLLTAPLCNTMLQHSSFPPCFNHWHGLLAGLSVNSASSRLRVHCEVIDRHWSAPCRQFSRRVGPRSLCSWQRLFVRLFALHTHTQTAHIHSVPVPIYPQRLSRDFVHMTCRAYRIGRTWRDFQ